MFRGIDEDPAEPPLISPKRLSPSIPFSIIFLVFKVLNCYIASSQLRLSMLSFSRSRPSMVRNLRIRWVMLNSCWISFWFSNNTLALEFVHHFLKQRFWQPRLRQNSVHFILVPTQRPLFNCSRVYDVFISSFADESCFASSRSLLLYGSTKSEIWNSCTSSTMSQTLNMKAKKAQKPPMLAPQSKKPVSYLTSLMITESTS